MMNLTEIDSAARSTQELLNAVWDMIFALPVYRTLELDRGGAYDMFPFLLSDPHSWAEMQDKHSEAHAMFQKLMDGLEYFPESLRVFRGQLSGFLELYVEPLKRRSVDAYAAAFARYYGDMKAVEGLFSNDAFQQSFPTELQFVPMVQSGAHGKAILGKQAAFSYLTHFLYADFYRGLMAGNAPRHCHNCGRYFCSPPGITPATATISPPARPSAPAAR